MHLYRLIYVSKAATPPDEKTTQAIAEISAQRNRESGVTGILLATRSHYLQVLEGEAGMLNRLYGDILSDERHRDLRIIGYQPIVQPLFSNWAMKATSVGLMGRFLFEQLKKKYGQEGDDLSIPLDEHLAFALLYDVYMFLKGV
jgi:hypothetical protein